jgi:hypothetical protein
MKTSLDNLDPERVYEAIADGVHTAIWRMITNATSAPCADFYHHVKQGVADAIAAMNFDSIVEDAVNAHLPASASADSQDSPG